jgi:hypothetical protein
MQGGFELSVASTHPVYQALALVQARLFETIAV